MNEAFRKAKSAYGTGAYDDATIEFLFPQLKRYRPESLAKRMQDMEVGQQIVEPATMGHMNTIRQYASSIKSFTEKVITVKKSGDKCVITRIK